MMQPERMLMIGEAGLGPYRSAGFFDKTNYNEFEIAFWFLRSLGGELDGRGIQPRNHGQHAKHLTEQAAARLMQWITAGHSLIIFTTLPFAWPLGPNYEYTLSDLPFFGGTSFEPSKGELIEWCGPDVARELMEMCLPALSYEVVLGGNDLQPLFRVSAAVSREIQLVGALREVGNGKVFFVPPIRKEQQHAWQIYIDHLANLPKLLGQPKIDFPSWSSSYQFQDERVATESISRLETAIEELEVKILEQQIVIDAAHGLKILFFDSGDHFKDAVAHALRELGLKVVDGPHPRADLIAFNGQCVLAIEAKGVDGPAREMNFRQVEQWAAEIRRTLAASPEERKADPDLRRYAEKLEELGIDINNVEEPVECKPLLIVGTFRKTPLNQRSEPDFPDPVARTINRSTACAITGLQLLALLVQARSRPDFKMEALNVLRSTNGVFRSAEGWQSFLTKTGEGT